MYVYTSTNHTKGTGKKLWGDVQKVSQPTPSMGAGIIILLLQRKNGASLLLQGEF
jgi:hypothetical protein